MTNYGTLAFGYSVTSVPDPRQVGAALGRLAPDALLRRAAHLREARRGREGDRRRPTRRWPRRSTTGIEAVAGRRERPVADRRARAGARPRSRRCARSSGSRRPSGAAPAAAPMRVDTHQIFTALGLPVAEIWGMSETAMTISNPPDADQDGHGRQAAARRRGQARPTTASCWCAARSSRATATTPEQTARGLRGARPLAEDRRRRDRRRGRLLQDRRPQEGDHHQRGGQEHRAGDGREPRQGAVADHRPRGRDRRPALLPDRADRARRGGRARLRGQANGLEGSFAELTREPGRARPRSSAPSRRRTRRWPASSRSRSTRCSTSAGCRAATRSRRR